jgi:hypothetical protein
MSLIVLEDVKKSYLMGEISIPALRGINYRGAEVIYALEDGKVINIGNKRKLSPAKREKEIVGIKLGSR